MDYFLHSIENHSNEQLKFHLKVCLFFQEKEEEEQERREREYVERMAAERLASLEGGNSLDLQQTVEELMNGNVIEQSPENMPNKL